MNRNERIVYLDESRRTTSNTEAGPGGAFREYTIALPAKKVELTFQQGSLEDQVNGVTHEQLLAILIDRLSCFQEGDFACYENARALTYLKQAKEMLLERTESRRTQGIEGQYVQHTSKGDLT